MGYIDENYDGVIIKLPSFFIKVNNLESILDNFKKELEEKAKLSLMLPDYTNSLFGNYIQSYSLKPLKGCKFSN